MRAVILPATGLLVPGLVPGLLADPLAPVRTAVRAALADLMGELTASRGLPLVVAHGPVLRDGVLRPTLAASGIGDHLLPDAARAPWSGRDLPAAGTGASVALLALADVLGHRAGHVVTLEVPADRDASSPGRPASTGEVAPPAPGGLGLPARTVDLLRGAACLVVAGGAAPGGRASGAGLPERGVPRDGALVDDTSGRGIPPDHVPDGVRRALRAAGADEWGVRTQVFEQSHEQLPSEYRVTVLAPAGGPDARP